MADKQELEPMGCPFCGVTERQSYTVPMREDFDIVVIEERHTSTRSGLIRHWYVICSLCGARGPVRSSQFGEDRDDAVRAWNRAAEKCKRREGC